jgi:hypothetical protein
MLEVREHIRTLTSKGQVTMQFVDTNLFIRHLTRDDPQRTLTALRIHLCASTWNRWAAA